MSKVVKEAKRFGRRVEKEYDRTRPEDLLSMGATTVVRESTKKGAQEAVNAVTTLTGARQQQKAQREQERKQAQEQRELIREQERADEEARVRRRSMLRATLSERPNLFSILGSQQGAL